jgi:hypothetical protein
MSTAKQLRHENEAQREADVATPSPPRAANDSCQDYTAWPVSLNDHSMTLSEARKAMRACGDMDSAIPLVIQLVENPRFSLGRFDFFRARVGLAGHDCIHALLGRGLMPLDEAFVVGYTAGASRQVGRMQQRAFCWIASRLYPEPYRFGADEIEVYYAAHALGLESCASDLAAFDFDEHTDRTLASLRTELGINLPAIDRYNEWEHRKFPHRVESARLTVKSAKLEVRSTRS